MGEKAAMTDKDQQPTQGTDQDIKPKHPHRSIMEYMDAIEQAAPADKAARTNELMKAMKPSSQSLKALTEEINRANAIIKKVQPFLDAIFEAYPNDAWFMDRPIEVILSPIGAYMQDRGLQDGEDIDAHRKGFLAFFKEYIDEMEAAYQPGADLETLQETTLKKLANRGLLKGGQAAEITRTIYPIMAVSLIDKVSKKAFAGELTEQLQPLKMERSGSLKKIDTFASINFSAPELQGLKCLNLSHYEKAVMDAIINLYIVGNEYITLQMIYQAMRGDSAARLSPAQARELSDCITRFMYGGIRIDATQEAKAYNLPGSVIYDTNLLHIERVMHNLNGTITECIHIIKTPVLYEYASSKKQIGRVPMAAIATPLDKNKETFALQSYLLERVLGMRGGDPKRDIVYSSIYGAVWGKEANSSKEAQSGYIRVKRIRLRKKIFTILEHWATEGTAKDGGRLIQSFEEYPPDEKKTAQGIRISF